MAETEQQRQERELKELEGKNVAHYSVMLSAFINARIDANKAIFAFSSTGIGLLVAVTSNLKTASACSKLAYIVALIAFLFAVISTLFVYINNANAIESYIRNDGGEKNRDYKLKTWMYVNYILFGIGLVSIVVFSVTYLLIM